MPRLISNCCVNFISAAMFFVVFVLMAQFVLVNVVVAVLMKHLAESHKQVHSYLTNYYIQLFKQLLKLSLCLIYYISKLSILLR